MAGISKKPLPKDFLARLEVIRESTPMRVKLPELRKVVEAVEKMEKSGTTGSKELMATMNKFADSVIKAQQEANKQSSTSTSKLQTNLNRAVDRFTDALSEVSAISDNMPTFDTKALEKRLEGVSRDIKSLKLDPKINLPAPQVNVELGKLEKSISKMTKDVVSAVKANKPQVAPEIEMPDNSEMVEELRRNTDIATQILTKPFPVPTNPTQIAVTNPDGTNVGGTAPSGVATEAKQDDTIAELSPLSTIVTTAVTLTTLNTAYLLPSSEQTSRRTIVVYNISDTDVYLGDSSVTTTNGILLATGEQTSMDVASGLYAVCGASGKILNVLEMK